MSFKKINFFVYSTLLLFVIAILLSFPIDSHSIDSRDSWFKGRKNKRRKTTGGSSTDEVDRQRNKAGDKMATDLKIRTGKEVQGKNEEKLKKMSKSKASAEDAANKNLRKGTATGGGEQEEVVADAGKVIASPADDKSSGSESEEGGTGSATGSGGVEAATGGNDDIEVPGSCPASCKNSFAKFRKYQLNEYAKCKEDCKSFRDKLDSYGREVEKECFAEKRCWQQLEDAVFLRKKLSDDVYHKEEAAIVGDDQVAKGSTGDIHLGNPCTTSSECRSACCGPLVPDDFDELGPQVCLPFETIEEGKGCHRDCQCKNKKCNPTTPESKDRVCGKMDDEGVFPTGGGNDHVIGKRSMSKMFKNLKSSFKKNFRTSRRKKTTKNDEAEKPEKPEKPAGGEKIREAHEKKVEADRVAELEKKKKEEADKLVEKLEEQAEKKKSNMAEEAAKKAKAKAKEEATKEEAAKSKAEQATKHEEILKKAEEEKKKVEKEKEDEPAKPDNGLESLEHMNEDSMGPVF